MRVRLETKLTGWEVFPEGWPRRAFDLIANSWPDVRISSRNEAEEDFSGKLHTALLERFYAADKEWYPTLEQPCVDEHGKYFNFTDLRFDIFVKPPQRCVFAVENRRLNAAKAESKYAVRYVEEGITRFVTGKYSPGLSCGGMVGFVMDGNCALARNHIASAITARRVLLAMSPDAVLEKDADLPCFPDTGRTEHTRNGMPFTIKHMFLAVEP